MAWLACFSHCDRWDVAATWASEFDEWGRGGMMLMRTRRKAGEACHKTRAERKCTSITKSCLCACECPVLISQPCILNNDRDSECLSFLCNWIKSKLKNTWGSSKGFPSTCLLYEVVFVLCWTQGSVKRILPISTWTELSDRSWTQKAPTQEENGSAAQALVRNITGVCV